MKSRIQLVIALIFFSTLSVLANDEKFVSAMQKNIKAVYEAQTPDQLQAAVNSFERIATAEPSRWEPLYYSAFGNLMLSARETDAAKKDQYIDLATQSLKKASALKPNDSEILALEGFALMMRLSVDPASRGPQYAGASVKAFEQALAINPQNPRALSLLAQMQYGTAEFFNSPPTEACQTNEKALELFAMEKPESLLAPAWGRTMAMGLKQKCK